MLFNGLIKIKIDIESSLNCINIIAYHRRKFWLKLLMFDSSWSPEIKPNFDGIIFLTPWVQTCLALIIGICVLTIFSDSVLYILNKKLKFNNFNKIKCWDHFTWGVLWSDIYINYKVVFCQLFLFINLGT